MKLETSNDRAVEVSYTSSGILYLTLSTAEGDHITTRMTTEIAEDLVELIDEMIEEALEAVGGEDV